MLRRLIGALLLLAIVATTGIYLLGRGLLGQHEAPGEVTAIPLDEELLGDRRSEASRTLAALGEREKQILFGDLHVHTTFSSDAFVMSLPLVSGEGAHPPADACDFARHCAALDFWSINDHAESLTPAHWRETVESIRQCNSIADPENPDVTAFLGWEWTQDGTAPENHWGHKNVILRGTGDDEIPARPIAALQPHGDIVTMPVLARAGLALLLRDGRTLDFNRFLEESASVPFCAENVPVRELPSYCREATRTPGELFAKLDEWGVDSLVIPHGSAWGNTAPAASSWDAQIGTPNGDPERQFLFEIYSGHGNSEEFRDFAAVATDSKGNPTCPEPLEGPNGFLPNCWRAGEIIEERCLSAGEMPGECEARARAARKNHVAAGRAGFRTVRGAKVEDWQDSGQCRDCFLPAFDYRPRMSAQYLLARRNFDGDRPQATRMGFLSSSDNHTARPGTGYKELDRSEMTESKGPRADAPDLLNNISSPEPRSIPLDEQPALPFGDRDIERMSSFFTTGGLAAVHADGRDREAIWQALQRREVYGTSGERILLYFDLLNGPDGELLPMGSTALLDVPPRFRVRAAGARRQKAGCPNSSRTALGAERLHHLCRDECHNPDDTRKRITRIEVVRVRPQVDPGEPIADLVEDPWKRLECGSDEDVCIVTFDDPDFVTSGRDAIYYVRAIQERSPAVNGGGLRCQYDAEGRCTRLEPCHGNDARTDYQDDCLAEIEPRAWSSPIWIDAPSALGDQRTAG